MMCFRGNHTILLLAIAIVLPIYLYVLVPYAVCAGDAHYVPSSILFDWKVWEDKNTWWKAAERSATDLHLAFLHPNPREVFRTNILELLAKILLPVVTILLAPTPLCEMIGVMLIGLVMWVTWQQENQQPLPCHHQRSALAPGECHDPPGLRGEEDDHSGSGQAAASHLGPQMSRGLAPGYPHVSNVSPKKSPLTCSSNQDLKLFTFLTMACGVFTVYLEDPESNLPVYCCWARDFSFPSRVIEG